MKAMHRIWIAFTLIMCYVFFAMESMASTNLGTLQYWESNGSTIGRWKLQTIKVYANKLNANGGFYFGQGMSEGATKWSNALGVTVKSSVASSYSNSPIIFYGGTAAEINITGKVTFQAGDNGRTYYTTRTQEGSWVNNSTTKTGYTITKITGYIVDNDREIDNYRKTCLHELGHALGWFGHSTNTTDVMYSKGSDVTVLTTRDVRHLSQVY